MTVSAILDEVRRCGAVLYRTGDCLRLRPASAIPADLVAALRAHKTALLRLVPEQSPESPSVPGCWRVVIEQYDLRPGPIRLDGCTTITDSALCVERTMADLELAVAHKNAGRETSFATLVDEYVARLAACGCAARVEVMA